MSNAYFRFKQFAVRQQKAAMKVGTDGVLLGAWVNIGEANRILDVGTGTGLVALMLAQRSPASIDAVEIDVSSCEQAQDNVNSSPWCHRISVINKAFQEYWVDCEHRYDLIVSNPPYFIKSLKSPELSRTAARHTELLSHDDLLDGISKLLFPTGRFAGIFPYLEGNIFTAKAANYGLYCVKRVNISGKERQPTKRLMLEFEKERAPIEETNLAVRRFDDTFTDDYRQLTKDFYLAF